MTEMRKYQVWYMKPEWFRDGIMGDEPNGFDLAKTHIRLKDVEIERGTSYDAECETIWVAMQGENWSPNGEARPLIEEKGLRHTSMSMCWSKKTAATPSWSSARDSNASCAKARKDRILKTTVAAAKLQTTGTQHAPTRSK